jgi:hypothetical protein
MKEWDRERRRRNKRIHLNPTPAHLIVVTMIQRAKGRSAHSFIGQRRKNPTRYKKQRVEIIISYEIHTHRRRLPWPLAIGGRGAAMYIWRAEIACHRLKRWTKRVDLEGPDLPASTFAILVRHM